MYASLEKKIISIILNYVSVWVYVCEYRYLQKKSEAVACPGAGVTDSCVPSNTSTRSLTWVSIRGTTLPTL